MRHTFRHFLGAAPGAVAIELRPSQLGTLQQHSANMASLSGPAGGTVSSRPISSIVILADKKGLWPL